MQWILYIFIAAARFVKDRKGRLWGMVVIISGIGIYLFINSLSRPRNVAYPENPFSAEYRWNLNYIMKASMQSPPDFSNIRGGFLCSHLAIVDVNDFPLLIKKLRYDLYNANRNKLLFYSFVLGGLKVRNVDQPLLEASKKLSISGKSNVEIALVSPTTASSDTKEILEKKGIKLRLITRASQNHLR
jgi:hypothetical protein